MRRALSVGLLIQSAAWCAAPAGVLAVRYSTLEGSTRIVIETDVEVRYRSEALHEPERLFFDLAGATPRFGEKGLRTISVDDPRVKRIRVAQTLPGTTRVVLDLETAVEVTTARASNPARIVIELRPKAPAPPLAVEVAATVVEPPPPPPPVAEAARRTSTGGSSMIRALGLKIGRVVLDPGHGGYDQGSAGPGGLLEKDLVLDVARRLGELIEQRMGSEVVYTRDDDTFVALEARAALANEKKADLFLSIHANSSPYASVAGVETYYLNFTTARDALDVAARENAGSTRT
ncbi:MAG: N-acetylmuramoyl-L-alanine amidase, partial [Bryobacteraceae bacterium]